MSVLFSAIIDTFSLTEIFVNHHSEDYMPQGQPRSAMTMYDVNYLNEKTSNSCTFLGQTYRHTLIIKC